MILLALDETENECLGGEPVFLGAERVGSVTSATFGHSVGMRLAMAFVSTEAGMAEQYSVELLGQRIAARMLEKAPYDPDNLRVRV